MRQGLSLRWKLILGSAIVEVVMLSLLVVNSVRLIESSLSEQANLRLKEVSTLLNASIGPHLAAQDYAPILDVFSTSRNEQGIQYFALWDNRGRLIAMDGWPAGRSLPPPQQGFDPGNRAERIDVRIPISVEARPYGELQFGISTRFLAEARQKLTQQSLLIASAEVVLSLLLLALLGIWLTRHLNQLEEASVAVSQGDFSKRVEIKGGDETGRVAAAFNRMASEIEARLKALRESEERFRGLSDLTSDWYWEQDAEFRFTRFAGGAFRDFPDLADSLTGIRRWDSDNILCPPEQMAAHRATVEAHKPFRDFEYQARTSKGALWISVSGEPVFDEQGGFLGYRGTGRDVTERREADTRLAESELKFASLFQLSPLPLALTDVSTGLLADVNEAWSRLFSCPIERAISQSLAMLHLFEHDNERSAFEGLVKRYGRCELIEAHMRTQDGQSVVCELSGRTLEIGDHRYFVWCARDVTLQRRIEIQVRELNTQLEARVAERTRELRETMETLQLAQDELIHSEKLAALGRVVAAVAHELNTPIGNSVMVATTLDEKAREFGDMVAGGSLRRSLVNDHVRDVRAGTEMLLRNLQQAHNLIHSFKQVAVDQSSDRRREFELNTMLDEVLLTLAPTLRKTPFVLERDIPPGITMNSYPGPLGQVITNFVNNALIHAFDGRTAGHMKLSARSVGEDQVEIRFIDDGRGIDAEHLKHIFDPFFTTRLGQGGSGLGLNIVYNLITRILGGRVDVHSAPGEGTTFVLILPLVAPQHGEHAA